MACLLFWCSLLFILFTYIGYPAVLWLRQKIAPKPVAKAAFADWPSVTVVIAAKNEEESIGRRLDNILVQDYPAEKMEILVVSDGSTDTTVDAVLSYAARTAGPGRQSIRLVQLTSSVGKAAALNSGVTEATGEILVLTDARQTFGTNGVRELVANFQDPLIGGVSGELLFVDTADESLEVEMGTYWKYEKFIRKMESASGSVIGATGAIYAVRRELFPVLPQEAILDDVLVPLKVMSEGKRFVFDAAAKAYDRVSADVAQEWNRKVRTLAGNWQLVSFQPQLLNPLQNSNFARFFWHKFARLLVPFFLVSLFVSSIMVSGVFYRLTLYVQLLFYSVALVFPLVGMLQRNPLTKLCYFFCMLNTAAAWAFVVWLTGRTGTVWKR